MKNKKLFAIILNSIVVVLALASYFAYKSLTRVTPLFSENTYELGNVNISEDITSYIEASEFILNKTTLDISDVDADRAGSYLITCDTTYDTYSFDIHIVDTTAPVIGFGDNASVMGTYNEYSINDLDITVSDLSPASEVRITSYSYNGDEYEICDNSFEFTTPGTYIFNIEATDIYGNTSSDSRSFDIVPAPEFLLINDREYMSGTNYTPYDFVYAEDRFGNDITDNIIILDDSNFDPDTPGSYQITYSVKDNDDIGRISSCTINISDTSTDNNLGFEFDDTTLDILINHEYFQYEPLTTSEEPYEDLIELTSPTSFGVCIENNELSSSFSAFIYKVTTDYVYFFTNAHCEFFDGDAHMHDYTGRVIPIDMSEVITFSNPFYENTIYYIQYDMQLFAVPVCYFDNLLSYREVHIDLDAYNNLHNGDICLMNTQAWNHNTRDIVDINVVTHADSWEVGDINVILISYGQAVAGCSGSPYFDQHGNLLGILRGTRYIDGEGTTTICIPVNGLVTFAREHID